MLVMFKVPIKRGFSSDKKGQMPGAANPGGLVYNAMAGIYLTRRGAATNSAAAWPNR